MPSTATDLISEASSGVSVILSIGGDKTFLSFGVMIACCAFVTLILTRNKMYDYTLLNPF